MTYATVRTTLAADSGCAHDPKQTAASGIRAFACAALLFAMAPLAAAPLPVPEVLHYTFDETGTTVTNHASAPPAGTETGTILGSTYSQNVPFTPIAYALTANGTVSSSTDYLNTNWATNFGTGSWTISFFTSDVPASSTLFYIFGDANANSFRCFTNGVAGAGNYILRGGGLTDVLVNGAADGGSHMVTFVYDQPNNQVLAYKDAVLVNTVAQGAVSIVGIGPYKIGGYATNIGLNGKMADYRIYSHALTPAEILDIYTFITTDTPMTAAITAHTDVSCHGGNDGSLTVTPTGGLPPFDYLWSNGDTQATASNLSAGTYSVQVTDNYGLVSTPSDEVIEPAAIVFTTTTLPDGYGLVPYTTNISASGGTGAISYAVTTGTLPPGLTLATDGTLSGTPTTLGTYNFSVGATDANTCLAEQAFTMNVVVDPADFIFVDGFDGPP
ncbi:hypothetical protein FHW12_003398 [Dokdonella fugitiva]|uniref:Uncharacterized protein n=1 Tax=Dokdonella fugitiva TaxID=328517 RepID=A0A839EZC5_9GAMM|nr:putative Ig domain-containing protein [Dokdonella fugitiva]MBA8889155.1 hypothetical protein [Dokdonella fugitiva]